MEEPSLEKTMMLGKVEGKRRREQQRMRWLKSISDSTDMNLSKLWKTVRDKEAWHAAGFMESQRVGHCLATEQQQHCLPKSSYGLVIYKTHCHSFYFLCRSTYAWFS